MAWRFQPSKFKNTTPKPPKKEATIFDLPIGNLSCTNNGIQTSDKYFAFHIDGEGGKLGVLPITARGRRLRSDIGVICAHGEQLDDFGFMPFASDLLVTCSRDDRVKLWRISGGATPDSSLVSEINVGHGVLSECLKAHSTADNIVGVASPGNGHVIDIEKEAVVLHVNGLTDKSQSLDWSPDGSLLAIGCDKGRQVCVYDPRSGSDPIQTRNVHHGLGREGRVLFCGKYLLSSGFTNKRTQEVRLLDCDKWSTVHTQEFVSTTGILIPHYDPDTKLLFLTGKGTNKMFMLEQQDRQPLLSHVFELTLAEQSLGACLGSKRTVSVMEGEVDIFYQLAKSSILPIPCIVPRRSYRDFHGDLFPDTIGPFAGCSANMWLAGNNDQPVKISLAPGMTGAPVSNSPPPQEPTPPTCSSASLTSVSPVTVRAPNNETNVEVEEPSPSNHSAHPPEKTLCKQSDAKLNCEIEELIATTPPLKPAKPDNTAEQPNDSSSLKPTETMSSPSTSPTDAVSKKDPVDGILRLRSSGESSRRIAARVRPKSCVIGMLASKFRHVETIVGLKANNAVISNLRNVNTRLPPECNGACVSGEFIAVPLTGPAGLVGIYDVNHHEKIPSGVMDGVCNKALVTDLQWNPFDDFELAVGTDSGVINIWRISKEEGPRLEMEPVRVMKIGGEKVLNVRWHPLAANLLAVSMSDSSIELWNTELCSRAQRLTYHEGAVLAMAWSADGRSLVSVGKDAMLIISQPQNPDFLRRMRILENVRAARVLFVCEDRAIVVVSFTKGSGRQVQLYDADTLRLIWTQPIDSATQPLVPHYDNDSSVLFLSGKGDRIVHMYEVCYDSPYFLQLLNYQGPTASQAIAYHNKKKCDVMAVEFQRAWRITDKAMELMIFRVPRVKKDVFQSDLFPDALVTWKPVMSANEWLAGDDRPPVFQSLKPDGISATGVPGISPSAISRRNGHGDVTTPSASSPASDGVSAPACARASVSDTSLLKRASKSDLPQAIPIPEAASGSETGIQHTNQSVAASISARLATNLDLEQNGMEGVAEDEWRC